jgi:hypothetical protein
VNKPKMNGATPVFIASAKGFDQSVKLLAELGADVTASTEKGCTPLHVAAEGGHVSTVELLLKLGADMNTVDAEGCTPLTRAVQQLEDSVVRFLLQAGADCDIEDILQELQEVNEDTTQMVQLFQEVFEFKFRASLGDLAFLKAHVERGTISFPRQWINMLPSSSRTEFEDWIKGVLKDQSACHAALFRPIEGKMGVRFEGLLRDKIVHDGQLHLGKLIASFLVFPRIESRAICGEIDAVLKTFVPLDDA